MTAIFFRELKSYYDSMTGWIVCAFIIMITGIYFFASIVGFMRLSVNH